MTIVTIYAIVTCDYYLKIRRCGRSNRQDIASRSSSGPVTAGTFVLLAVSLRVVARFHLLIPVYFVIVVILLLVLGQEKLLAKLDSVEAVRL